MRVHVKGQQNQAGSVPNKMPCLLSAATADEHIEHRLPFVRVVNALPKNSKPMQVSCSTKNIDVGKRSLVNGEVFKLMEGGTEKAIPKRCGVMPKCLRCIQQASNSS